jgi:hypothetical protein
MSRIIKDEKGNEVFVDESDNLVARDCSCKNCNHTWKSWFVTTWCPVCDYGNPGP